MNCLLFLFAMLVGVTWGYTRPPGEWGTTFPQTTAFRTTTNPPTTAFRTTTIPTTTAFRTTTDPTTTAFRTTTDPPTTTPQGPPGPTTTTTTTESTCVETAIQAEALDNPEDVQYQISEEESQELLAALETEGIGRNGSVVQDRNAEFIAPSTSVIIVIEIRRCPHFWRRMVTLRIPGPCGKEVCEPLPEYVTDYAVCSCSYCNLNARERGLCLPSGYRTRLLEAFCYHPELGWNIRVVKVRLPTRCDCHRVC